MAHSSKHHGRAEHPRTRTVVITVLSLIVLATLTVGLIVSPVFAMRSVTVEGEQRLSEAEVLRAGGLDEDTNVLLLSVDQTRRQLLANPWIAEAEVVRSLPATLTLRIQERRPVAVARDAGGYLVIGNDGTTLTTAERDESLPQIKGGRPAPPGERSDQIVGAAAAAASWDQAVLAQHPVVTVAADGTLSIELDGKVPVLWGDARDPEEKAEALAGVLAWADEHRAEVLSIDVRVPHAPAAELRERGSEGATEEEIPIDDASSVSADPDDGTATSNDNERNA